MEKGTILPYYGSWLVQHLQYYEFRGESAIALKEKLISVDLYSESSADILIQLYQEFLDLFVNDIFSVFLCFQENGIISLYPKAYLVENAYGVLAPIAMMEEIGQTATYDLETCEQKFYSQFSEETRSIIEQYSRISEYKEQIKKMLSNKKNKQASFVRGGVLAGITLLILLALASGGVLETYETQNLFVKLIWGGGIVMSIISTALCLQEFLSAGRLYILKKMERYIVGDVGDGQIPLVDYYKMKIKENFSETGSVLPVKQEIGIYQYIEVLCKDAKIAEDIVKNNRRIHSILGMRFFYMAGLSFILVLCTGAIVGINNQSSTKGGAGVVHDELPSEVIAEKTPTPTNTPTQKPKSSPTPILVRKIVSSTAIDIESSLASSELKAKKSSTIYVSEYAHDGDLETCWQDGETGNGEGSTITLNFSKVEELYTIEIVNGRVTDENKYFDNGRIATVFVYCYRGEELVSFFSKSLQDVYSREPLVMVLAKNEKAVQCDKVILEIVEVYDGKKYDDLCVTEIICTAATYGYVEEVTPGSHWHRQA